MRTTKHQHITWREGSHNRGPRTVVKFNIVLVVKRSHGAAAPLRMLLARAQRGDAARTDGFTRGEFHDSNTTIALRTQFGLLSATVMHGLDLCDLMWNTWWAYQGVFRVATHAKHKSRKRTCDTKSMLVTFRGWS